MNITQQALSAFFTKFMSKLLITKEILPRVSVNVAIKWNELNTFRHWLLLIELIGTRLTFSFRKRVSKGIRPELLIGYLTKNFLKRWFVIKNFPRFPSWILKLQDHRECRTNIRNLQKMFRACGKTNTVIGHQIELSRNNASKVILATTKAYFS